MKKIKLFKEFKDTTLNINRKEYDLYYQGYKDDKDTSKMMMWMTEGSQEDNFEIVSKYIDNNDSILDFGCGIGDFPIYLKDNSIKISDYLGVDINQHFIDTALESHDKYDFKYINNIYDITSDDKKWDKVVAIGVFTIYIEKEDFIETINKLYELCNKEVLITCNKGKFEDTKEYWKKEYRQYNEDIFLKLFPYLNIEFDYSTYEDDDSIMLVRIIKNEDAEN